MSPTLNGAAGCVESFNIAYKRLFEDDKAFRKWLLTIASTTIDDVFVSTGKDNGANVIIKTKIISNPNLPEQICIGHCGSNAIKDLKNTFGLISITISNHENTVSYTHRRDIFKAFRVYCSDVVFANEPKQDVFIPKRWPKAGATRMPSHLFSSMLTTHKNYDVWLLFLDDRSTNGRDTETRISAMEQFHKLIDFKKGIFYLYFCPLSFKIFTCLLFNIQCEICICFWISCGITQYLIFLRR